MSLLVPAEDAPPPPPSSAALYVPVETTDAQLVELWLHGKSLHTQRAYRTEAERFLSFVARPLRSVTLMDLQAYADSLGGAPATRIRALAAVKSLLTFGQRTGFLVLNVGAALKLPPRKDTLAERILDEAEVHTLLAREPGHRNRVLLRLLYRAGLRVSEIAGLCWRDLHTRDDGGQVTVFGKGGKTRTVLLPADVWRDLVSLRGDAVLEDPVFRSRRGRHLDPSAIFRIVRHAAERAELEAMGKVSPHWLRHAHATHALERGAPIHLVQATLGHTSVATTGRYLHARPTDSSARYTSG
ncbi:MAG TPA: tyrosine-type recombinase/integrase [Chloroflexota bacterium]